MLLFLFPFMCVCVFSLYSMGVEREREERERVFLVPHVRSGELHNAVEHGDAATSGSSRGTRVCPYGHIHPGRVHGRSGEIFSDVSCNQSRRGQETVRRGHTHTPMEIRCEDFPFRIQRRPRGGGVQPTSPGSPHTGFNRRSSGYFGARVVELD